MWKTTFMEIRRWKLDTRANEIVITKTIQIINILQKYFLFQVHLLSHLLRFWDLFYALTCEKILRKCQKNLQYIFKENFTFGEGLKKVGLDHPPRSGKKRSYFLDHFFSKKWIFTIENPKKLLKKFLPPQIPDFAATQAILALTWFCHHSC